MIFINGIAFNRLEQKIESHKEVCENKNLCGVIMLLEDTKIIGFNQY